MLQSMKDDYEQTLVKIKDMMETASKAASYWPLRGCKIALENSINLCEAELRHLESEDDNGRETETSQTD
jgi:hypothetical protein